MSLVQAGPPPARAVRNSPLLVVFGRGPAAEDLAGDLAGECTAAGLTCRVRAVDDCSDLELAWFPGLIVVLPELLESMSVRAALEPFAELMTDYRARWPHGVAQLGAPGVDALGVGVVQLVGDRVLAHNPTLRSAYRRACVVHLLDQDGPVDVLAVYEGTDPRLVERESPWDDPHDAAGEALERTWAYLRSWGILDPQTVPGLLGCLERCRANYEKRNLSELYRPSPEWHRNRLDLILDGPDLPVRAAQLKTWNENGARVWREVFAELRRTHPGLHRPGRPNAPGAQKDLRRLYESLKIVTVWLRTTPPRSADSIG